MLGRPYRSISQEFDADSLRAELARRNLRYRQLAKASGLGYSTVAGPARGEYQPGELARIKLERGMEALGIDPDVAFGPSETKTVEQSSSAESE